MTRILIIDDEPGYRDPLDFALSGEGYEVRTAASGREALALGDSFVPDLLIVDWMLRNHIDGLQVAESLQAANPKLRMIVITGYPTDRLRARIESLPEVRCLTKPFRLADLLAAVREAAAPGA